MTEIRGEIIAFITAIIAGMTIRFCYHCLTCIRNTWKHKKLLIEIEDILYWIVTSLYLFVQIYYTSNGVVRWFFVLGIVLGAIIATILVREIKKVTKKIYNMQLLKNVDKNNKKRYYYK